MDVESDEYGKTLVVGNNIYAYMMYTVFILNVVNINI